MRTAIEVGSGELLDLADPNPALIDVEDIAGALSKLCRFTGHVTRFYSVAEHAVLVADILQSWDQPPIVQNAGLHHDDQEAYIGDVSTPLKALLPDYRAVEERVTVALRQALGLPELDDLYESWVHYADQAALVLEAKTLLPSGGAWLGPQPVALPAMTPQGWSPEVAKMMYLERHEELARRLKP